VAGPALSAAGTERVVEMNDLAVIGFSGVVARLPRILRAFRRLLAEAESFRPDAAVLVDSPGFNFRLGPALKRRGVPIFYYIAPQVWAWHPERAHAMSRWVDRLAVVFPFEEPLFQQAGVSVRFVGHPLLDGLEPERDEAGFREELGVEPAARLLAVLPGSRRQEIRHHLPVMLEAARALSRERPDLVTVLPLAPGLDAAELEAAGVVARATGSPSPLLAARAEGLPRLRVVRGRTRATLNAATACAVASGTATLESALFRTPLVIVYRTGRLNYALARRLVRLDHIGLPNVIAGAEVAPELLQADFNPPRLTAALAPLLDDASARARAAARLTGVRERLGEPGASRRAAELLWDMVA
jgi:lipid-A-disaccharide synthase